MYKQRDTIKKQHMVQIALFGTDTNCGQFKPVLDVNIPPFCLSLSVLYVVKFNTIKRMHRIYQVYITKLNTIDFNCHIFRMYMKVR